METITLNTETREHLAKIAKTFRATHVFTRSRLSKQPALLRERPDRQLLLGDGRMCHATESDGRKSILLVWERVWARDYPNCVKTISELHDAKSNNRELYNSSRNFLHKEMEIIQQEWDIQYPPKLTFISESMIMGYSWDECAEYADQVGLIMFNKKFYGKNVRGGPEECVEYEGPSLIGAISTKEQNDAIATFAEILEKILF